MTPSDRQLALQRVLARYPAIVRPCAEPESLGNAGGLSGALLWRYASGRGPLAARAWPPESPPRETLETIHRWIAHAARVGLLAVPIPARDGRSVQQGAGRLWEVSPWLPGQAPRLAEPPLVQIRAAFTALGAVHLALHDEGTSAPGAGLRERMREIEWWINSGFSALGAAVAHVHDEARAVLARHWLEVARRAAPQWLEPLRAAAAVPVWCQPCLRDVRPEHFLFTGERVTGLVDYGAMGIDCVAGDLARLLSEWLGPDRSARAAALAAYSAIRPLSERETAVIEAFETSAALLGAGRWAGWHFLDQRPFRDPNAVTQGLRKGVDRLAQRMAAALA